MSRQQKVAQARSPQANSESSTEYHKSLHKIPVCLNEQMELTLEALPIPIFFSLFPLCYTVTRDRL